MDDEAVKRIEAKLDAIVLLLAAPLLESRSVADGAQLLGKVGLNSTQIAELCGITPDAVRKALSRARHQPKEKRAPSAAKGSPKGKEPA